MKVRRPWSAYSLTAGIAIWSVSALAGGPGLFLTPDGSGLGFDPAILQNTPFADFLLPGVILALLGVGGAALTVLLIRGMRARGRRGRGHGSPSPWQWYFALIVTLSQLVWMAGEIALLWSPVAGLPADQRTFYYGFWSAFGSLSVVNLLLASAPSVRHVLGGAHRSA